MKKNILLASVVILFLTNGAFALTGTQTTLGKIEESLYGFQYDNESDINRLNRIEETVYGTASNKSMTERLAKLSKDISVDAIGEEITPTENTLAELEEETIASDEVSYPVIDEMEEKVFNKNFDKTDIKTRISKLEEKTFNKTFTEDDLSTRVDRLKAKIEPNSLMNNQVAQSSNVFYDKDIPPIQSDFHLNKYMSPNSFDYEAYNNQNARRASGYDEDYDNYYNAPTPRKVSLTTVEKKLLKKNFSNEPTENRLARIENVMFGSEFAEEDVQTRIDRISSAYQAQKSAGKYDSNKFSQNMATAMQIGTLILMVLACIL